MRLKRVGDGGQAVIARQHRCLPEAGQVEPDDLALGLEPGEHGAPSAGVGADAGDEDERTTGTGPQRVHVGLLPRASG